MTINQRIALSRYRRHVAKHGIVGPVHQDIRDYAPDVGRDYARAPANRQPMARRERGTGKHGILAAAIVLMLVLIALALLG